VEAAGGVTARAAVRSRPADPGLVGEPELVAPRRPPPRVPRSAVHGGRRFSTRSDYEAHLTALGWVKAPEDIWEDAALVAGIQRDWHTQGQTGCLFARNLARTLSDEVWPSAVITHAPERGADLDRAVAAAIASADAALLSVLFSGVDHPRALVALLAELARSSQVLCAEEPYTYGDLTVLRLRAPVTDDGVLAWILAFGPFGFWPATRRGPVTELVIRVKPKPPRILPRLDQDRRTAHVADTPIAMADDCAERMWQGTRCTARRLLGEEASILTSADVTLCIPSDLGADLRPFRPPGRSSPG
jgi:hypothetical protein